MTAHLCSAAQQTSEDAPLHWPGASWPLGPVQGGLRLSVFPFLVFFQLHFPNTSILKHAHSPHGSPGVPMPAVPPGLTTASTALYLANLLLGSEYPGGEFSRHQMVPQAPESPGLQGKLLDGVLLQEGLAYLLPDHMTQEETVFSAGVQHHGQKFLQIMPQVQEMSLHRSVLALQEVPEGPTCTGVSTKGPGKETQGLDWLFQGWQMDKGCRGMQVREDFLFTEVLQMKDLLCTGSRSFGRGCSSFASKGSVCRML